MNEEKSRTKDFREMRAYYRTIENYPLLTRREEQKCFRQIKKDRGKYKKSIERLRLIINQDQDPLEQEVHGALREVFKAYKDVNLNRQRIILGNVRLVIKIAAAFYNKSQYKRITTTRDIRLIDLIAAGNVGLMEAIDGFDYRMGNKFSTYAHFAIERHIKKFIIDKSGILRVSSTRCKNENNLPVRIYKGVLLLRKQLGREPSVQEIADFLNIKKKVIVRIKAFQATPTSLNNQLRSKSGDEGLFFSDLIEDKTLKENQRINELKKDLLEVLNRFLPLRWKEIIMMRYGLNGAASIEGNPMTGEEVGKILGITRQAVNLIEKKAIQRLKNLAGNACLQALLDK